jgi:hypothetical protein
MAADMSKNGERIYGNNILFVLHLDMKMNCIRFGGVAYEKVLQLVFGWAGYLL